MHMLHHMCGQQLMQSPGANTFTHLETLQYQRRRDFVPVFMGDFFAFQPSYGMRSRIGRILVPYWWLYFKHSCSHQDPKKSVLGQAACYTNNHLLCVLASCRYPHISKAAVKDLFSLVFGDPEFCRLDNWVIPSPGWHSKGWWVSESPMAQRFINWLQSTGGHL